MFRDNQFNNSTNSQCYPAPSGLNNFYLTDSMGFALRLHPSLTYTALSGRRADLVNDKVIGRTKSSTLSAMREGQKWKYCLPLRKETATSRSCRQYCNEWPDPECCRYVLKKLTFPQHGGTRPASLSSSLKTFGNKKKLPF